MTKKLIAFLSILSLSLSLPLIPAHSATKAGAKCNKVGIKSVAGNKTFTCIKSGKKLVWNKGVVSRNPTPTPSPTTPTSTLTRNFGDKPDEFQGFQVKIIYVVPKDGIDRALDLDGSLQKIVTDGNSFLFQEIQRTFPMDTWQGNYDIEFFRSSLTSSEIKSISDAHRDLFDEMKIYERRTQNRKLYSFWIDVDTLGNGTACGYTNINDIRHAIAIGPQCSGRSAQFTDNRVTAWVHEALHNIGVEDTNEDGCEFMSHESCSRQKYQIDPERKFYVGVSTSAGSDVLRRRVWSGSTANQTLEMPCRMLENLQGVCTLGKNIVGPPRFQWSNFQTAELQDITDSSALTIGKGTKSQKPWGTNNEYTCSSNHVCPSITFSEERLGLRQYRWIIDGVLGETFSILWQK
jgi:hypothetical protein